MSASLPKWDTSAAREVVGAMVRLHGYKRGLAQAADALGVSESWAKKIHNGVAQAVSAGVAERAAAARGIVLRARLEAARREIEIIEGALNGMDMAPADARCVSARGLVR